MKKLSSFLSIALLFLSLPSCEDKEDDTIPLVFVTTDYNNWTDDKDNTAFVGTTIKLYETEEDFLFDENVVEELTTNAEGEAYYSSPKNKSHYVRAENDTLSNLRFGSICTKYPSCDYGQDSNYSGYNATSEFEGKRYVGILLSTIPAKLSVTVSSTNSLVAGAEVTLYWTYEDYINDKGAWENIGPDNITYALVKGQEYYYKKFFYGVTDSNGQILFDALEARKYWIRVTKDGKTNAASVDQTPSKLSSDPNVTTALQINIQ